MNDPVNLRSWCLLVQRLLTRISACSFLFNACLRNSHYLWLKLCKQFFNNLISLNFLFLSYFAKSFNFKLLLFIHNTLLLITIALCCLFYDIVMFSYRFMNLYYFRKKVGIHNFFLFFENVICI